jgi:sugar lactone lactonase YvrE
MPHSRRVISRLILVVLVAIVRATSAETTYLSTDPKLRDIEILLRRGETETARRAVQAYTEILVQNAGGTFGDHRADEGSLSRAMASTNPPASGTSLAQACALWAVTEAAVDRREEARWHWYVAQNLSREFRSVDLSSYGRGGVYLMRNSIKSAQDQHANLDDILDPVRPEEKYGVAFQEPVRTRVVYPRLPDDLRKRDRFSHVVFVQITVNQLGEIAQPMVLDAGFYPGLIYRAFEALREWRYQPARLNGKPVSFRYIVPVAFSDDRPSMPVAEDGGPFSGFTVIPVEHALDNVSSIAVSHRNVIYVADRGSNTILRIRPDGASEIFAGGTGFGLNGDGKHARDTEFNYISDISLDERTGELFVADTSNYRIRSISLKDGTVQTVAGIGLRDDVPLRKIPRDPKAPGAFDVGGFSGDGGPATEAELNLPSGVCADPVGMLFIADSANHRVRVVNRGTSPVYLMGAEIGPGGIATVAGTGRLGFSGDGGPARDAQLAFPSEVRTDLSGNLLIVDTLNQRIRRVDRQSGIIHTIAYENLSDLHSDQAALNWSMSISGVTVTVKQEVIYGDRVDQSVHMVSPDGTNKVIYKALPLESRFSDLEATMNGAVYVADTRRIGVLRVPDAAYSLSALTAVSKPSPSASGEKIASGIASK